MPTLNHEPACYPVLSSDPPDLGQHHTDRNPAGGLHLDAPATGCAAGQPNTARPAGLRGHAPRAVPAWVVAGQDPARIRADAARHLYSKNQNRIYRGKMPPLLYAIGVLQVEVDWYGRVTSTSWMRAPTHAPEVVAEIERTVYAAAPYPAPARMGRVTYTDTWLWHRSGTFQLDTLTEGQY